MAKTRGVEHPQAEDMALIGPTAQELHTKSLPKVYGPNYGLGKASHPVAHEERECGY